MTQTDLIVLLTTNAFNDLFLNARAVPEDKHTWKPTDTARSILNQVQECVHVPKLICEVLKNKAYPDPTPSWIEQQMAERAEWQSLEECFRIGEFYTQKMLAQVRLMSEEELAETVFQPWKGEFVSLHEVALRHYWNMVYHTGQICYVQTLLGDRQMYQ